MRPVESITPVCRRRAAIQRPDEIRARIPGEFECADNPSNLEVRGLRGVDRGGRVIEVV